MLLALCGRAGSGKTSVANYLVSEFGATKVAFAQPLKEMAMAIWGFTPQQVYGDARAKEAPDPRTGLVPRWAMQQLGQAARTHLGQDVWIRALFNRIQPDKQICVIEDLRYINEAEAVFARGGYVLRLHCSDSISIDAGVHSSEVEVDRIPVKFIATEIRGSRASGLPDLFSKVSNVMTELLR